MNFPSSVLQWQDSQARRALSLRFAAVNINSQTMPYIYISSPDCVSLLCGSVRCHLKIESKICRICMSTMTLSHLNAEQFSASFKPQTRRFTVNRTNKFEKKNVKIGWHFVGMSCIKQIKKKRTDSVRQVIATMCTLTVELVLSCEIWLLENAACIKNRIQRLPHYKPKFSLSTFTLCVQEFALKIFGHYQTSTTNNYVCVKM